MKVKKRTICQTCRRKKISCDGKKPSCSQCLFRDLGCPGYEVDWTFVSQNSTITRGRDGRKADRAGQSRHAIPSRSNSELTTEACSPTLQRPLAVPLSQLVTLIVRSYAPGPGTLGRINTYQPRVCGAWVEVLPDLIGNGTDKTLCSAVRAFALSILSGGPESKAPVSTGLKAYSLALCSLSNCLSSVRDLSLSNQVAAAVMCVLLAELFLPTTMGSWNAHLQGFGRIMELSRPETYTSGVTHRFFVGARPALIVLAVLSRKASFLATRKWRDIPFSKIAPSALQSVMSEGALIPGILERLDSTARLSRGSVLRIAEEVLRAFSDVVDRLDRWERAFQSSTLYPSFWPMPASHRDSNGRPCIWFPDVTAANALTHFWAFRVICLSGISKVTASYPELEFKCQPLNSLRDSESTETSQNTRFLETVRLSIRICQSIDYLLQDEMKLFGPTSVILPLRTAYDTFEAGGSRTEQERVWCKDILAGIIAKGYRFVPVFFEAFGASRVGM
ncbi:hypothetical protein B0T22DRAFT_373526 [Podospora appendiculata]|uniref:Zn(2)-C6 fungal-type domain-containing protein n=1 Tax=Podospora appendiculata TaxID=314037 RepID=A0AAE0XJM0_9PEZI|nr:hypothetical protein B0T22DRAFT_373526 [Podospora appendiculata]